jgi:predicted negative regulator of RcsB-dependent stress response
LAEKKVTRKDLLKEPDEFITTSGKIIRFVREQPKLVAGVALLLGLSLLIGLGIFNYQKYRLNKSNELFLQAHREYENSSAMSASPELWDQVLKRFESIAKDYGSLPPGEMALLYSGHVLYKKGDFKGALEKYDQMQSAKIVREGLAPLIMYHIAMTKFALKDYESALTMLDQLSKDLNSPYRREAFASIARIYESIGKNMEAVQAYKQYLKMFPEAPDAVFIKTRISELSAKA